VGCSTFEAREGHKAAFDAAAAGMSGMSEGEKKGNLFFYSQGLFCN